MSEPAKIRSVISTARSAPKASALRSAASAMGGPMVMTLTVPPKASRTLSASSSA